MILVQICRIHMDSWSETFYIETGIKDLYTILKDLYIYQTYRPILDSTWIFWSCNKNYNKLNYIFQILNILIYMP